MAGVWCLPAHGGLPPKNEKVEVSGYAAARPPNKLFLCPTLAGTKIDNELREEMGEERLEVTPPPRNPILSSDSSEIEDASRGLLEAWKAKLRF